jgi:hypothetical protein
MVDRRWDQLAERADALQEWLEAEDVQRPVLYGVASQGDAWPAYNSAIDLIREDDPERQVRPAVRSTLDPDELQRLLTAHEETLTMLRRGAHCQQVRDPIDYSEGFMVSGFMPDLLATRSLANLAVTQALAKIDEGHPVAAVETLLDAAQFGRDLMHRQPLIAEMIGCAILTIATIEVVEQNDLLDRLPPPALERLGSGLEILDANIPRVSQCFHGEALLFARTMASQIDASEKVGIPRGTWRYGFSSRLMLAMAGIQLMEQADLTAAAARGPWSACATYLADWHAEARDGHNPVLAMMVPNLESALVNRFHTIARLRLLRMAIEHRLGRDVPELADPFGSTLHHSIDEHGEARFWSAGAEGAEDLFLFRRS